MAEFFTLRRLFTNFYQLSVTVDFVSRHTANALFNMARCIQIRVSRMFGEETCTPNIRNEFRLT